MPNNVEKIIGTTVIVVGSIFGVAAWLMWPRPIPTPPVSVESLVAKAKFNGADLVMQSAYTVCPSRFRKYMIAFRGRVHYFIDTNSKSLSIKESPINSGNWELNAPPITIDSGFTSDIDENGKSWRRAWVLNGAAFVDDTTRAADELQLLDNYALHIAYNRLTETPEIKKVVTEQISQFVRGVIIGAGKKVNSMSISFENTPPLTLPDVNIKFCEDDNGVSVKP